MRRSRAASMWVAVAAFQVAGCLLVFPSAHAAQLVRSSFLALPQSIRHAGAGGIGLGESSDAGAGGMNPARLVRLEREIAAFAGGGVLHGTGARYFLAGGGYRTGRNAALGAVLTSAERRLQAVTGQNLPVYRELTQSTMTIAALGAWSPTPHLAAGLGLKVVREGVVDEAVTIPALDAGVQAGFGAFTVGAAVRNLAPATHPESGELPSERFPAEARLEAAARLWPSLALGFGYTSVAQRDGRIAAGCEWAPGFARALLLRAGLEGIAPGDQHPSAGFTLYLAHFAVDYAFMAHPMGATHLVGLGLAFDRPRQDDGATAPSPRTAMPLIGPNADAINVAVADLEAGEGTPAGDAVSVADILRAALVRLGSVNVVERTNMQRVLAEQAVQQTGCTRQDCAVKLGRVLNVQRIVVGRFGRFLGAYKCTVQVVDVETGRIVLADEAAGETRTEIESALNALAGRIGSNLR